MIFVYISNLLEILYVVPWNEGNTVKESGERKGTNSENKDRRYLLLRLRVFHQNNKYYLATQ